MPPFTTMAALLLLQAGKKRLSMFEDLGVTCLSNHK